MTGGERTESPMNVRARLGTVLVMALATIAVLSVVRATPAAADPGTPSWVQTGAYVPFIGGAMAFDAGTGQLLDFGGDDGNNASAETFEWTGGGWNQVDTAHRPSPREGASMAYDSATGQLILFGGDDGTGTSGSASGLDDDTWAWTGSDWSQLTPAGDMPNARTGASLTWDPSTQQMILFGGYHCDPSVISNICSDYNDTWLWSGSRWIRSSPSTSPPGREFAEMGFDPATSQLLLVGGTQDGSSPFSFSFFGSDNSSGPADMWNWTGSNWVQILPDSPMDWPGGSPTFGSMGYDPDTSQLLLVNPEGPTQAWNGAVWTDVADSEFFGPAAFDPMTDQFVESGGVPDGDLVDFGTFLWGQTPVVTSPESDGVEVNQPFSFSSSAYGVPAPTVQWQVSDDGGNTWSDIAGATSATYSGVASPQGDNEQFQAVWSNSTGQTVSRGATLSVQVPLISGTPDAQLIAGTAYSYSFFLGGLPSTTSVSSGSLPPGLSLSSAGVLSGTPITTGSFTATVSLSVNGAVDLDPDTFTIDVVSQAVTTVNVQASGDPVAPSQSVTYTATISHGWYGNGPRPTGSVNFTDGGVPLPGCSNVPVTALAPPVCTASYASDGSHTVVAAYTGDSSYESSTSVPITEVVELPTGAFFAWGADDVGQFGDGVTGPGGPTIAQVRLPDGAVPTAMASNSETAYAIGSDHHLYSWGDDSDGELGNGTTVSSAVPVLVALPSGVAATAVAASSDAAYAIGSDGHLYAWGDNPDGELGNGTTVNSSVPVQVALPSGVTPVQIATGQETAYAIGSDGHLYAWGNGADGALGDGSMTGGTLPVPVELPSGVKAVAGGFLTGYAIGANNQLYAWGNSLDGGLGNGSTADSAVPVQVTLPSGVEAVGLGAGGECTEKGCGGASNGYAIGSDGKLYSWGYNGFGALGDGSTTTSDVPVQVDLPVGVRPKTVAGGDDGAFAIGSDGQLYGWGEDQAGQLGPNTANSSSEEVPVSIPLPGGDLPGSIATGASTAYAVPAGGALEISTTSLPVAIRGSGYSTVLQGTGGVTPYRWRALTALPKGLKLSTTGVLSGTPSTADKLGAVRISVQVQDASKPKETATTTFTFELISTDLYIVGHDNAQVVEVKSNGAVLRIKASGLSQPNGVAVDSAGDVYIADTGNNRVVKITPKGKQTVFATGFNAPTRLRVDDAGNVYVADTGNNRVVRITPGGTMTTIGTGLNGPIGVAVDQSGDVFIGDTGNNRVVEVDTSGAQRVVPTTGLLGPQGVAVDSDGDLYIDDGGNNRIVELALSAGDVQSMVPISGLDNPNDVTVDGLGDIYVSDHDLGEVVTYSPGGGQSAVHAPGVTGPVSAAIG
jgi:alpha-tubulin suppressor-like RCC1 family protein/sugar lactone lactonase YvrE